MTHARVRVTNRENNESRFFEQYDIHVTGGYQQPTQVNVLAITTKTLSANNDLIVGRAAAN